jgi:hypothetical protein
MSTFGDIKVSTINGGPTGAKNAIINGNFGINQRGVSGTVTLSAGVYGHDRWKAGSSGCTYTFATSDNVTTIDISAGSLIQVIEGINLESGTYTLSWTGTAQGKIGAGSYGNSGITGTATGGTNLDIEFDTGTVSLVQFEPGTVVTPFERRQFGQELALCQRYLPAFNATAINQTLPSVNFGATTTNVSGPFVFKVSSRVPPTGLIVSSASHFKALRPSTGTVVCTAITFAAASTEAAQISHDFASGIVVDVGYYMQTENAAAQLLLTGCEL